MYNHEVFVRFFVHSIPCASPWVRYGARYLRAIKLAGIPCRAVPLNPIALDDLEEPWRGTEDLFCTPLQDDFINMFCACAYEHVSMSGQQTGMRLADAIYTDGHINIAITGGNSTELAIVLPALLRYDQVLTPTEFDMFQLMAAGVQGATFLEPSLYPVLEWYWKLREWKNLCA